MTVKVSRERARRFWINRQLLAPARSLTGQHEGILRVFRQFGSVQFDPLAVAGRNHDLVLHARVAGYQPAWTDELLYSQRRLFETFNKGLSLLPIEELPWYRLWWTQNTHSPRVLEEHDGLAKGILQRIREEGPLSTSDFQSGTTKNWFGGNMKLATLVLDALVNTGVLGLSRRAGNRRYFDLIERLYPAELLEQEIPIREQYRHKMLSRFRAHGLLGIISPAMVGIGPAKADSKRYPGIPSRTELREELVADGSLVPIEIEGIRGPRFVLKEELAGLDTAQLPPPSVAFLAPLDPVCWDPAFLRKLFDFEWVWEVYLPPEKRRWGYYVLPLLYRDRLVGRIEPRIDRAERRVRILGLSWEPWFRPESDDQFIKAMTDALQSYLAFAQADYIEWGDGLRREQRLFAPA